MAQNEMKAMRDMPLRVRSTKELGCTAGMDGEKRFLKKNADK